MPFPGIIPPFDPRIEDSETNLLTQNSEDGKSVPQGQMPMNPMMYLLPMMGNPQDMRQQSMNNFGFMYAIPQPMMGNRQQLHLPPLLGFGEKEETTNTSVFSGSNYDSNPTKPRIRSTSPMKLRSSPEVSASFSSASRGGSVEAPRLRQRRNLASS